MPINLQSAPGGPRECRRLACRARNERQSGARETRRAWPAQTHRLWVVGGVDSLAIEEESDAGGGLALTLAEGVHELLQLGGALDLEVDFVVVVRDLDVEVLAALGLLRRRSGVGHCFLSRRAYQTGMW